MRLLFEKHMVDIYPAPKKERKETLQMAEPKMNSYPSKQSHGLGGGWWVSNHGPAHVWVTVSCKFLMSKTDATVL